MNRSRTLRVMRTVARLSQEELASLLCCSASAISLMEAEKRTVTDRAWEKLAQAFGVSITLLEVLGMTAEEFSKVSCEQATRAGREFVVFLNKGRT